MQDRRRQVSARWLAWKESLRATSMSMRFVAGIMVSVVALVVAFVLFYTPEGHWTRGSGGLPPIAVRPVATALPGCLKVRDANGLATFTREGVYRMSGWFLSTRRRAGVVRCMAAQGWLYIPLHLYSP